MWWFRVAPPVGNTAPLLPQAGMLPQPEVARQLAALTSSLALRHAATKGILVAMACTFFEAFNVPVFWPILVMYFIMLFCITMKRQIKVSAGGGGRGEPRSGLDCPWSITKPWAIGAWHSPLLPRANTDVSCGAAVCPPPPQTACSLGAQWETPSVLPCWPHWHVVLGAQSPGPTRQRVLRRHHSQTAPRAALSPCLWGCRRGPQPSWPGPSCMQGVMTPFPDPRDFQ